MIKELRLFWADLTTPHEPSPLVTWTQMQENQYDEIDLPISDADMSANIGKSAAVMEWVNKSAKAAGVSSKTLYDQRDKTTTVRFRGRNAQAVVLRALEQYHNNRAVGELAGWGHGSVTTINRGGRIIPR